MIDCLIIGFNDGNFEDFVKMVASMGQDSGAFKDLDLTFIEYENKPYRSMDILNRFYFENKPGPHKPFHNADFIWPVITYLTTYLTRRGFNAEYVNLFHLEKEKLREKLLKGDIRTIAITTTLYVSPHPILEIISFIRQYNTTAKIIVGGPHISNEAKIVDMESVQSMFKYMGADVYVISAEGEYALSRVLGALRDGGSLDEIDNIGYRRGDSYVITRQSIESNKLEENLVDYTLFPRAEIGEFVSTRTAKSCPFACSFCGFPARAGKYTYESVEHVERELNAIRDLGTVTTLTFIDDTFNVPKARFKEVLRMMIRNKYEFKWNSTYRSDHGDEEAIELMREAGCEGVFLGIESGSPKMLKIMNKTAKREEYMRAIPLLNQAGISTYASLVLGFPGETYETVQETISLLEEAQPEYFRAQLWYCDPVTPIWQDREKYGIKGAAFNWSHDTMDVKTACDLIDKLFLSVEGSTWLPQNGFEQWSTFYLQRKGMSREQLRNFVKCFNSIIKEKLLYPGRKQLNPQLLEGLKRSCQFDREPEPDMRPVERLSGRNYLAAEQYWANEFGGHTPAPNLQWIREEVSGGETSGRAYVPCAADASIVESLRQTYTAAASDIMLAAYGILLARLNEQQEVVIAATTDDAQGFFPLKLSSGPDCTFKDWVTQVRRKASAGAEHSQFALYVTTRPLRMAEYGNSCPVLDAGYMYTESVPVASRIALEELQYYPQVREGMGLILTVEDGGREVGFIYRRDWFKRETVEGLGRYFTAILEELAFNAEARLRDVAPEAQENFQHTAADSYLSEAFDF